MARYSSLTVPAFDFKQGDSPLLVSMPHSGLKLTEDVRLGLSDEAKKLPDTDWFIPEVYDFLESFNVGFIRANYSRYVIDLNRPYDDEPLYKTKTTGLFPELLFEDSPVFVLGKSPGEEHKQFCKENIWVPYHSMIEKELARLKDKFGFAILFDAHSIAAEVPMLFEGVLPDLNWGTNEGKSCHSVISEAVIESSISDYTYVLNGRFKGGYITRRFGQPDNNIHAIQLELSQATYLDEGLLKEHCYKLDEKKMPAIQKKLRELIDKLKELNL
jgi:formiminoglutamase